MFSSSKQVQISWGGGEPVSVAVGTPWLAAAQTLGYTIPTGCLHGSCGACEIEVNGHVVRACIEVVTDRDAILQVDMASDPYW